MRDMAGRLSKLEGLLARPRQHILWVDYAATQEDLQEAKAAAIAAYEERTGERINGQDQRVYLVHWRLAHDSEGHALDEVITTR